MKLTNELQPVPKSQYTSSTAPAFRLVCRSEKGHNRLFLSVNRAAKRLLGLDPTKPGYITVLASTRLVAICIAKNEAEAHRLNVKGEVFITSLLEALAIKAGESFVMTPRCEGNMLVAELPDDLRMRIGMAQRRERKDAA